MSAPKRTRAGSWNAFKRRFKPVIRNDGSLRRKSKSAVQALLGRPVQQAAMTVTPANACTPAPPGCSTRGR